MEARAKDAIEGWNKAKGNRGTWENHWQQITQLCLPERNDYNTQWTPGQKRNQQVYDSTPIFALQQFANGLHSLLTSPYLLWFQQNLDDERLNKRQDVRAWLDEATRVMYSIFNGPRHNFASQSHEYYLDLGSIGTAVMAELESDKSGILFSTRHLKEAMIFENDEDRVDKVVRRWRWTAKQAVQQWGNKVGPKIVKAYTDGSEELFYFYHQVAPRKERNLDRASEARHMPFESIYVGEQDGDIISESGFPDFPYLVSRFSKTPGEVYGRGPGMTMLPDMKMLNELKKMVIKAAQKVVDPPLQIPDDGYLLPIKTVPGSQNFYRANSPPNARIMPIETKGRIDIGENMLQSLQQTMLRGFYVEWMMMASDPTDPAAAGKGVTATYVMQQRDEKMRLLSPMLARLQSEFLGPLIDRTFNILWRQSVARNFGPGSPFPPPPEALSGQSWHIEYLSPIAIAQKSSQLDSVGRLMAQQAQLMQMNPNAPMILDPEAIMRLTSRDLNAPAVALKTPERLQQEAQAQAEAQQQMAGSEVAGNLAGAAKDGAAAMATMREAA